MLQARRIVHTDLKSENILIAEIAGEMHPKVADFGLSKTMDSMASVASAMSNAGAASMAGTMAWKAPGTFAGKYDEKSDIFSYGVTCFEMVSRKVPFEGKAPHEIAHLLSLRGDEIAPRHTQLVVRQLAVHWRAVKGVEQEGHVVV